MIESLALQALYQELACYPKPGLVSFVDVGSHDDMDAETFLRSIDALRGYFFASAVAGADGCGFDELNVLGRAAEQRMSEATNGRNTHRGAIFSLGLLAAAAGATMTRGRTRAAEICALVAHRWGEDVLRQSADPSMPSHGEIVRRRYGVNGAREQAAAGFPCVVEYALPAFEACERRGAGRKISALHAFFAIMAVLQDNNLLFRGGEAGLRFVQDAASGFLAEGGMLRPAGFDEAEHLHRRFVAARLSPGGAADLLAATLFVTACEKRGAQPWA